MKSSREQAAKNRELVIEAAGRLFRERGFDGISVAEIMQSADLTHGGFYSHFNSKSDLAALACQQGLAEAVERWQRMALEGKHPLRDIVEQFLSVEHRDSPETGCYFAALAASVPRQAAAVKRVFTAGLQASFHLLASVFNAGTKTTKRRRAMVAMSQMVGAMVLARAVDDEGLSLEILEAARSNLLDR